MNVEGKKYLLLSLLPYLLLRPNRPQKLSLAWDVVPQSYVIVGPTLASCSFFLKFTLASHRWKTGNRAHADDFDAMFEAWQARHGAGKFCSCAVHKYISTARMDECTILL